MFKNLFARQVTDVLYKYLIRPILFKAFGKDPENPHEKALALLVWLGSRPVLSGILFWLCTVRSRRLHQTILGMDFSTPLGLAAGFDKNGDAVHGLETLGFSHMEIGSITPEGQPGNERQRMFRFPGDEALINRMGFNNKGAEAARWNLMGKESLRITVGISLGKGKDTPLKDAAGDYLAVLRKLYDAADYFAVNVSSPNTVGLRSLQDKENLSSLLAEIQKVLEGYSTGMPREGGHRRKPLFVKISPDLSWEAIDDVIEVCLAHGVSGIIATNTTLSRKGLSVKTEEAGGMSGKPLFPIALEIVRYLRKQVPEDFVIIGVGGISTAEDAYAMLRAGANILQAYSGFVYGGPFFARKLNRGLLRLMNRDGIAHVSDLLPAGND